MNTRMMGSSSRLTGRLLVFVWAALLLGATGAKAAPGKTLVQDTLYRADGSAAIGTVSIRWSGFSTSAGEAVAAGQMTVATDLSGGISIPLIPNTGSAPSGSYYKVVIKLNDGTTSEEQWVVPAGANTTVAAIRAKVVQQAVAAQFVSRDYVDSALGALSANPAVHLSGAESIAGAKTFAVSPEVPGPTDAGGAANKGYVDGKISGLANVNLAAPGAIGTTTPNTINATSVIASGTVAAGATVLDPVKGVAAANLPTSVLAYGAKCDGTTDDTVALQAAFTALSGKALTFPPGKTCIIGGTLLISGTVTQWTIDGGTDATTIRSTAIGIPIIQFSGHVGTIAYDWAIKNLTLQYATAQPSGHAYCIAFGDGSAQEQDYFDGEISNIRGDGCQRVISNWGSGTVWGVRIHDVWATGRVTGSTIAYIAPGIGSVRMSLENIYSSQNANEPVINFNIQCLGCSAKNIESNNATNQVFVFGAWQGTLENLHFESYTCTTPYTIMVSLQNSQVVLHGLTANANVNINPGAGNPCYLIGSPVDGLATIDGVFFNPTLTSGGAYVLHSPNPTSGRSRYKLRNAWSTVPLFTGGEALLATGSVSEAEYFSGVSFARAEYYNPGYPATSSGNVNSDTLTMQGAYWTGTASAMDAWSMQQVEGSGANPASTLTFSHAGSMGTAAASFPGLKINGVPLASTHLSDSSSLIRRVANIALAAQTASVGGAPIYTVPVTGTYRLSGMLYTSVPGSAGTVFGTFGFNPAVGQTTYSNTSTIGLSSYTTTSVNYTMHAVAGSNVTYSTTVAGATGSPQYGWDLVVEQLQ